MVAIFEGNGNAARVLAASRPARRIGIEPGMTLPQARALIGKLVARARDGESERAAQEALLEVAESFSPRVEDAGEGVCYLDLDGLPGLSNHKSQITNHKFSGSPEQTLGSQILSSVEKTGLPSRIGIAGSKLAARVAAGLPDSPTVVAPGEEAAFLAPLSLDRLSPELETATTLARWGIRSIGDLAKLPEGEVASRLGELGRELHAIARGIDPRPLEPRLLAPCLSEGMELEWPLVNMEPFLFLGNAALERLAARLDSQALACSRLEVALKLDPDGHDARAIALPAPTRDVKTLLTLVRLELEARPPGAAIVGFSFTAHPDKPRRAQLSLFGPPALSPDRLATTIARLASLLGAGRVGSPRAVEGHRPERFAEVTYAPGPPPELSRAGKTGRGLLAIRVLRPPVELEVLVEELPSLLSPSVSPPPGPAVRSSARPLSVKSLPRESAESSPLEIRGSVKVAAGPWSLEDGWWSESPADRDYWDVELSDGALYRIYRDRANGTWYADGVYD